MDNHLPIIVVELLLVLGGTLAFGWWQLRDVKRAQAERRAREAANRDRLGAGPAAGTQAREPSSAAAEPVPNDDPPSDRR